MADPFVAEIRMFAGNFAPTGWALCSGQLIPISQNTALFSLLGTMYGGDGKATFALPNLQGNFPLHQGQGPGLSPRVVGESGGSAEVALLQTQIPQHTHTLRAAATATQNSPAGNALGQSASTKIYGPVGSLVPMADAAIAPTGVSVAEHENRQPYLTVNICIALQGIFPSRN